MLPDDLALLKMVWLNQAMSRYDTLNEVARDAAHVLPLLQQEFTAEVERNTSTGAITKSVMEGGGSAQARYFFNASSRKTICPSSSSR